MRRVGARALTAYRLSVNRPGESGHSFF
jgi:hypothetical protein